MKGIIQLGGIPFNWRTQRPQHTLRKLSKKYTSVYINYMLSNESIREISDCLYQGSLKGNGHVRHTIKVNAPQIVSSLESLIHKLDIDEPILLFDYPFWSPILHYFDAYKVIYNCMDDYSEFSDLNPTKESLNSQEQFLFAKADLVYCTAKRLYEKAKEHNDNVVLIPNACDPIHFNVSNGKKPDEIPYGKVVGFIGAIAEWFNQEAIAYAADQLPYWNFVLIGADSVNINMLKNRKNIQLLGEKPYQIIPQYLQFFDVAIIPFDDTMNIMKSCNPVKMYEYLAAGKAVVSSPLSEVIHAIDRGKDIFIADENHQWADRIELAYNWSKEPKYAEQQRKSIENDTWDIRIDQLLEEMKKIGC